MIRRPLVFIACLFLLVTLILMKLHPIRGNPPDVPENTVITVTGHVSDRQNKNDSIILILKDAAPDKGGSGKTSVLIYLEEKNISLTDLPPMGCKVAVKGKFSLFDEAGNPGQFDMRRYYHIRGIEYRLFNGRILRTGKNYDILREWLFRLRCSIGSVYDRLFDEKDSGVLKAMILGDRTGMDRDVKELYQANGIAHALSISGLHISILGYGLYRLLKKTGLNPYIISVFCSVFIFLYSIMTGGSTATVRAVIMFATCMTADLAGRTYDLLSALALSLMAILFTDPLYIYDSGFMLSFGAVAGIALVGPVIRDCFPMGDKKAVSGLVMSLSINLFTLPVVLLFFYELPLYSPLLNLMVIPLMGVLVVSAIIAGLSGMFFITPALIPAYICHLILAVYERGCLICRSIPGSVLITGRPGNLKIVLYYMLLAVLCIIWRKKYRKEKKEKRHFMFLFTLMILPCVLMIRIPGGTVYTMLDIGQGDCNVICAESGKTVMIDCGSSSEKMIAKYRVIPFLKYMGRRNIDAVILTHSDSDHINGYLEMLDMESTGGLRIKSLILPGKERFDDKDREIITRSENAGVKVGFINAGEGFSAGELKFSCLSPGKGFSSDDENENSIVLTMRYRDFSVLFTGDIEGEGERMMLKHLTGNERITVLKVAHHGSRNSTPEELLDRIRPVVSLISAGRNNRYRHPHVELIKRLKDAATDIHCTKTEGAVTVRTDGKKITVNGFLEQKNGGE